MDSLFGELPLGVKFLLAFAIVFILIVATFWLLRRFGGTRLGTGATRGRQPRLAVIDAAAVDGRRRLVLIRRDNVEHLVMIGGPSDVVIEQNIVRAVPVASARELPAGAARPPGAPEPRADVPGSRPAEAPPPWPQPEPAARRPLPPADEDSLWPGQEAPARPYRPVAPLEDRPAPEPARTARAAEAMQRIVAAAESLPRGAPLPGRERREPPLRAERREPPRQPPTPPIPAADAAPVVPAAPAPADKPGEPPIEPRTPPLAPDANLADMAQRLEAALRRPIKPSEKIGAEPPAAKPAPAEEAPRATQPPAPAAAPVSNKEGTPAAPRPGTAEGKPASSKSVLDSLEEEMASLLGRPTGKE